MNFKNISASRLQLIMVYGGIAAVAIHPILGIIVAGVFYKLYSDKKEIEDSERKIKREADKKEFKEKFYKRQKYSSYQEYLLSPTWREKRTIVMQRANGQCEKPGCTSAIEEVHHCRYPKIWGNEPTTWLIGLCAAHHREEHGIGNTYTR